MYPRVISLVNNKYVKVAHRYNVMTFFRVLPDKD